MVDFPLLVHTVWADGLIPRYSASLFSSQSKLNVPGVIYHFHPGYRYGGGCERVRHRRSPRFPLPHHWHRHQNMELRERPERLRKWGVNSQEHLSPVCLSHKLHLTLPNNFTLILLHLMAYSLIYLIILVTILAFLVLHIDRDNIQTFQIL